MRRWFTAVLLSIGLILVAGCAKPVNHPQPQLYNTVINQPNIYNLIDVEDSVKSCKLDITVSIMRLLLVNSEFLALNNSECPKIQDLLPNSSNDMWGTEFIISCNEDKIKIMSAGPDGIFKTSDDIILLK